MKPLVWIVAAGAGFVGLLLAWQKHPVAGSAIYTQNLFGVYVERRCNTAFMSGGDANCGLVGNILGHETQRVLGASPLTFVSVADPWGKDRHHAYCFQRVDALDGSTFHELQAGVFADATQVRLGCGLVQRQQDDGTVENFDPETFRVLGPETLRDKTGVYSKRMVSFGSEKDTHDAYATVTQIFHRVDLVSDDPTPDGSSAADFYLDDSLHQSSRAPIVAVPTRAGKGVALGCDFVRLGDKIYWGTQRLDGVDAASFRVPAAADCKWDLYGVASNGVWFRDRRTDLDPATFHIVGNGGGIACDAHHVMQQGIASPLIGKEPRSGMDYFQPEQIAEVLKVCPDAR